jgi:hypothetical protein
MISNVKVYGLEESIKASKYPMSVNVESLDDSVTPTVLNLGNAERGSGHDNFLKGIIVQFNLKMTPKMSVEMERYHFIDFVSSQSTMHKIVKFNLDRAYIEYVDPKVIEIMKDKIISYNEWIDNKETWNTSDEDRRRWKATVDTKYLEILYTNPCGFQLTSRMTTNYQQLKTIYAQRRNHRLPEWQTFCDWIETLPMFKELCLKGE